jgi:hypothetical protein
VPRRSIQGRPPQPYVGIRGTVTMTTFPATATHVGHPADLVARTGELLDWTEDQGLAWDVADTPAGQRWGARPEVLHTDPRVDPHQPHGGPFAPHLSREGGSQRFT